MVITHILVAQLTESLILWACIPWGVLPPRTTSHRFLLLLQPSSSRQTDLEKGGNNLLLPSPTRMIPDFGDLCGLTQGSIALHFQISAVGKNLSFQAFRWGSRGIVEARGY
jgi:hypothetical protein